jgi:predicted phosphate transport protein (TIGR00153 family)
MPTEENFFELFDEIAEALVDAAVCLHDLITDYQDVEHKCHVLRDMEKRVDVATNHICHRLNISFVTPLDREDIRLLASMMDDVLDYIEASADRMKLYGIEKPREEAAELSSILVDATKIIQQAVSALSQYRNIDLILKPCVLINELEHQGDKVLQKALRRLMKEETRPLEIAKWQEIFDRLETATDRCEDVANALESIVVKHA